MCFVLHHNKCRTNYHIHLILSARKLLSEADIKIATRSVFYDEKGKKSTTKARNHQRKRSNQTRPYRYQKGRGYESHLFTAKDERFKSEEFIQETKKDNCKAAEIEADNIVRQEWNWIADLVLVSRIEETKIL